MKILNAYIAKQVSQATAIVLVGFIGLELLFRLIDEMDNVINDYTVFKAIAFELLNTPATLYQMMPMVSLIGCLAGLGSLASTSELTIIRAAGVPVFRLVWMALRPALVFLLVALLLGELVAPEATRMASVMRESSSQNGKDVTSRYRFWLRDGEDFVSINMSDGQGKMLGVSVYQFNERDQIQKIIKAERAFFIGHYWSFEDVVIDEVFYLNNEPLETQRETFDIWRWDSIIAPEVLRLSGTRYPDRLSMRSLWFYLNYMKAQHLNSDEISLAFWKKAFYPLVMLSLVLIGISFVFGPLRSVTMGYRLFTGVLVGVVFKILQDALAPISIIYGIAPIIAMLIPGLISSLVGAYLLSRVR